MDRWIGYTDRQMDISCMMVKTRASEPSVLSAYVGIASMPV